MSEEFDDPNPETFWIRQVVDRVVPLLYCTMVTSVTAGPIVLYYGPLTPIGEWSVVGYLAYGLMAVIAGVIVIRDIGRGPFRRLREWLLDHASGTEGSA